MSCEDQTEKALRPAWHLVSQIKEKADRELINAGYGSVTRIGEIKLNGTTLNQNSEIGMCGITSGATLRYEYRAI